MANNDGGIVCAASLQISRSVEQGGNIMNRNISIMLGISVFAISIVLSSLAWGAAASTPPKIPSGWKFSLPDGDARSGKSVFLNMKCYSCHAIEIPGEKLVMRSKGAGPELNGYSVLPKEYLAESIIKFHTVVAAPGYTVKEGRAAMGEYNHFLTVQELVDLVAFLKQGPKSGAK
jgi:cytochrome c2